MPQSSVRFGGVAVFILIFHQQTAYSLHSSINCTDYRSGNIELPSLKVYDAADETPNYDNNGTVMLQKPIGDALTLGWLGLECSHTKPIRWVYDLNFAQAGIGDSYSLTARDVEDFYNEGTYQFRAEVEIKIHRPRLNFVLMCATFENLCERRVVQAFYDNEEKRYILKSLSKSEENNNLTTELQTALVKATNWGQEHQNRRDASCDVNFSLFDDGESYFYLFKPLLGNIIPPRSIPERQNLENSYLFSDHMGSACITDQCKAFANNNNNTLNNTDSNVNTTFCYTAKKADASKYWPFVFFMTDTKNVSRVVHTYHTLISRNKEGQNEPGRLKFAWEYSNPQDFLTMEELPTTIYLGQLITINCLLSQFLFSHGTQIGYISSTSDSDKISFLNGVEESPQFKETRVASGQMTFPLNYTTSKINITMFCFSPVWNSSTDWVNASRKFELLNPNVQVHGSGEKVYVLSLNTTFSTSCVASGSPTPHLSVSLPATTTRVELIEDMNDNFVRTNITIINLDESHVGFYNCVATNFRGTSYYEFEIKIKSLTVSEKATISTLTIALISVFGSISTIFLALVIILFVRFRMEKAEFKRLTEEAVREFFEGLDSSQVPADDQHAYANDGVKLLSYDKKYEVSHKHWSFSGTMLGSGAFGMVRKGVVEIGSRKSVIAIKTVKSPDDIDDFRATLLELKIMSTVGPHRHIVKLVAASTDEIRNRRVYIGVEYCANGSLLTYLQKRKKLFTNLVKDGRIQFQTGDIMDNGVPEVVDGTYMNLVTSDISTIDLFKWSFQIASGMDFLESKKVLHADLAARNILLTEDLLIKISDFGLSRELFENSEYMKKTQVVLPFKWMAPESLKWLKFSIKSDVWSYGVTLYEVFTLGDEPFQGQTWNEEFIQTLENGMRLERPQFCTENVYIHVMMHCWQNEPQDRMRFVDAMAFFEKAIGLLTSSPRNSAECRELC